MSSGSDEVLVGKACVHPDGLVGVNVVYQLQERQEGVLIGRLKGFASQDGETIDIGWCEHTQDVILYLESEWTAILEVPRLGLEAASAVVCASRHEQGNSYPLSVGDVTVLDVAIVHCRSSLVVGGVMVVAVGGVAAGAAGSVQHEQELTQGVDRCGNSNGDEDDL